MSYSKTKGVHGGCKSGIYRTRLLSLRKPLFDAEDNDLYSTKRVPSYSNRPERLCACGCGKNTTPIFTGDSKSGYQIIGWRKFIHTHQWKAHRNSKPKNWRSSYEIMRERDRLRIELAKAARGLTVPTYDSLRSTIGKIHIFGRELPNSSIGVMLSLAGAPKLLAAARLPKKTPPPISEYYPYISSGDGSELVAFVQSILPDYLYDDSRSEISQDILLALVSGKVTKEDAKKHVLEFIKSHFRRAGKYAMKSLNVPLREDSDMTLLDILPASDFQFYPNSITKTPLEHVMDKEEHYEELKYEWWRSQTRQARLRYSIRDKIDNCLSPESGKAPVTLE